MGRSLAVVIALAVGVGVTAPTASAKVVRCDGKRATIVSGKKHVRGTAKGDVIVVSRRAGATVRAGAGDDRICGGPGTDRLYGGPGADRFVVKGRDTTPDLAAGERRNGKARKLVTVGRKRTREVSAKTVGTVAPGPAGSTAVTFKRGARAPRVGDVLSIPISAAAPRGVLGKVVSTRRIRGGVTAITRPVALDEAYTQFSGSRSGTLGDLDAAQVRPGSTMRTSKPKFDCTGAAGPTIEVEVDLSKLRFEASVETYSPMIQVLLSGKPRFNVNFAFRGKVTCKVQGTGAIFVPVAGPLGVEIKPTFSVEVGGSLGASFAFEPNIAYGFFRSRKSGNYDTNVFRPNSAVSLDGAASAEIFLGLNLSASVGGRVGIGGAFGPVITASVFNRGTNVCAGIRAAARAQLTATADVFFKNWDFALATLTFGGTDFPPRCIGGGAGTGGDSGSDGRADPPRPGPGGDAIVEGARSIVSVSPSGQPGNAPSFGGIASADGSVVAFGSQATNLVSSDPDSGNDLFVRDLRTGTTKRIFGNRTPNRTGGLLRAISPDGRYIVFNSMANNLVAGDTNDRYDVFVYDRTTDVIERISVPASGPDPASVPETLGSQGGSISADGRYVTWRAREPLVNDDTNGVEDVFRRDRHTASTQRVTGVNGAQPNSGTSFGAMSDDGNRIAVATLASNFLGTFGGVLVRDYAANSVLRASVPASGTLIGGGYFTNVKISGDGEDVVFDTNAPGFTGSPGQTHSFVKRLDSGVLERIGVSTAGVIANDWVMSALDAGIDRDGDRILFVTTATNLDPAATTGQLRYYVRDTSTGTTALLTGDAVTLSDDGRHIVSRNPDDSQLYVVELAG